MRIELDARVLVTKWLVCRSIDQQASGFFADDTVANRLTIGNHGGILGHEFSPGGYRALQKSGHGGMDYVMSWRRAKTTFAGRSARRRMYHGYQADP